MEVRLNLATKPLVTHRGFMAVAAVVAVLGGLLCLILGVRFYSLRKAEEDFRVRSEKIQQETARLATQKQELDRFFAQEENASLLERANFIKSVIEARSFNWTQMFMDLEHMLPPGVHVLRIEPKLDKGAVAVKIVVGAVNQESKIKLLKAFEESKSFSQIELLSDKIATEPKSDPVTVELSAVYSTI